MMTLDEYMVVLRGHVDAFEANWRKREGDKKNPYPHELDSEAEWLEQFMVTMDAGSP